MNLPVRKIFWTLIVFTIGLLGIYSFFVLFGHFLGGDLEVIIAHRFNINEEANIPTWYSTMLLILVSAASFFIYYLGRRLTEHSFFQRTFWLVFGSVFCFLSIDEAAMIHEIIDLSTSLKWVYIYAPGAVIFFLVCAYYFVVVRKDDRDLRNWMMGGLVVFVTGGIVPEWISYSFHFPNSIQLIEFVVEEGLEMVGTVMVLNGCLLELNVQFAKALNPTGIC